MRGNEANIMNKPSAIQRNSTVFENNIMASPSSARLSDAFDKAKQDFLGSLKDPSLFNSIATVTSIDEIYAFTTQLQQDQSKRHGLRNLLKIKPFLDRLKEFASAIDVLVSAKPEILALIWGPIKFLLQMSDSLTKSFDAIVEAMAMIGNKLPLFEAYTMLFKGNDRVAQVLVLFYKDILDFYEVVLNFFSAKRKIPLYSKEIGMLTIYPRLDFCIRFGLAKTQRQNRCCREQY